MTDDSWYSLTAKKLAESVHCVVYADITETGITAVNGQAIANQYESKIYTPVTNAFGGIEDVDGNGKVIFLMLDIIDGYTGSGGYVAGYFDPTHMFATSTYSNSNKAAMLFMDTNPGFDLGNPNRIQNFYSTMAHELQHLIEWSETVAQNKPEKDLWINEGLSTAAEYIYGIGGGSPAHQTNRIDYFNKTDNYATDNTIRNGNTFFVWDNRNDVLADYSTAYLFFQWLRIQADNGTGIYKDIIASSYSDYRAVTRTAKNRIAGLGLSGTDAADTADWEKLLRTWFAANYVNAPSGGANERYGYKGEIASLTQHTTSGSGTAALYPGEGVFSTISTSTPLSASSNIKYADINGGATNVTGTYSGGTLLTFNADSDKGGSDETGTIAANVAGGLQASMQMSLNGNVAPASATPPLPTMYPIDVHFRSDGKLSKD
jgi:hypothetical protein